MDASPSAGTKLYMGGTSAAALLSDTYVEVGGIESIPEFGRSYNEVTFTPLADRGVQKYKGSYNDGSVTVPLAKDLSNAGQAALYAARDSDFDYNFKVVANDKVAPESFTVTISVATPGVFTKVAHGFVANQELDLSTSAADLPSGLTAGPVFVKTVLSADTFTVSATAGGSAIATSDAGTGVHTVTTVPTNSVIYMRAKVMSFTNNPGNVDAVLMSSVTLGIRSGSLQEVARLPGPAVS